MKPKSAVNPKLRFRLSHAGLYTLGAATVLAIAMHSYLLACMLSPVCVGSVSGYAISRNWSGVYLGIISAVFWTLVLFGPLLLLVYFCLALGGGQPKLTHERPSSWEVVVFFGVIAVSTAGGFVGGRVALH